MNKKTQAPLLGPSPVSRGVGRWVLGGLLTFGAWHLYHLAPLPGLVAVGLAPFANMYLFFQGLSLVQRGIPHWKTSRLARRLQLTPDWGCAEGGYLLVDESRGVWVANGRTGELPRLARLTCRVELQAFYLDLHEDATAPPVVSVGLSGFERLNAIAERLCQAAQQHGCHPVIVPLKVGD